MSQINMPGFAKELAKALRNEKLKHKLSPVPNFWDMIEYAGSGTNEKNKHYETDWARMLRWLLNPDGPHNQSTFFADLMLELVIRRKYEQDHSQAIANYKSGTTNHLSYITSPELPIPNFDIDTTTAKTEITMEDNKRRADILVNDHLRLLSIECKVGKADDNPEKLNDYIIGLKSAKEYSNLTDHHFAYLTPGVYERNEIQRSSSGQVTPRHTGANPEYAFITYADIEPLLERFILRAIWANDIHTQKIVEDFYFDIKRHLPYRPDPDTDQIWEEFSDEITLATWQLDETNRFPKILSSDAPRTGDDKLIDNATQQNLSHPGFLSGLQYQELLSTVRPAQWHTILKYLWDARKGQKINVAHQNIVQILETKLSADGFKVRRSGGRSQSIRLLKTQMCKTHDHEEWLHIEGTGTEGKKFPNTISIFGDPKTFTGPSGESGAKKSGLQYNDDEWLSGGNVDPQIYKKLRTYLNDLRLKLRNECHEKCECKFYYS